MPVGGKWKIMPIFNALIATEGIQLLQKLLTAGEANIVDAKKTHAFLIIF